MLGVMSKCMDIAMVCEAAGLAVVWLSTASEFGPAAHHFAASINRRWAHASCRSKCGGRSDRQPAAAIRPLFSYRGAWPCIEVDWDKV